MKTLRYWIEFPAQINLIDPITGGDLLKGPFTMGTFLTQIWHNPIWNESFAAACAQSSIKEAYEQAVAGYEDKKNALGMLLDEDIWKMLKLACEKPRFQVGQTIYAGIGYHPLVASQIVPFQAAVINALTEAQQTQVSKVKAV